MGFVCGQVSLLGTLLGPCPGQIRCSVLGSGQHNTLLRNHPLRP